MKRALLAIEAIVAAVPSALLGTVGFLVFFYSGLSALSYNPISGVLGIVLAIGIVFALFQYVRLAFRTVYGKPYHFNWEFWLAVPFACYAVRFTFEFGIRTSLFISGPIVLATLHFVVLQMLRRTRASSSSVQIAREVR